MTVRCWLLIRDGVRRRNLEDEVRVHVFRNRTVRKISSFLFLPIGFSFGSYTNPLTKKNRPKGSTDVRNVCNRFTLLPSKNRIRSDPLETWLTQIAIR